MENPMRVQLTANIDAEQKRAIKRHDKSQSQIAREALALWLEDHDQQD
jgi:hypothetical protein